MEKQEYTLEEISYSRIEERRIMERVLNEWFKDPKELNFTALGFSFPFKFKKWRSIFYNSNINQSATVVLKNNGWIISLIKPQFEIGKNLLGKRGVVKNAVHHQMVVDDIRVFFENEIDLSIKGIIDSPIIGPKGNKEFLIYGQK